MAKEIMVATRQGGGPDPSLNAQLRMAVERARQFGVPLENIERAIRRGSGEQGGADYEELFYEGYGPGGSAILVKVLTDNRNRTASEVRYLFSRNGGNMGEAGCVAWMFERSGLIAIERENGQPDEEEMLLAAAEAGADDVRTEEEGYEILVEPESLEEVRNKLEELGFSIAESGLTMVAKNESPVSGADAERLLHLLEVLEDHDDVQDVYSNALIEEA